MLRMIDPLPVGFTASDLSVINRCEGPVIEIGEGC